MPQFAEDDAEPATSSSGSLNPNNEVQCVDNKKMSSCISINKCMCVTSAQHQDPGCHSVRGNMTDMHRVNSGVCRLNHPLNCDRGANPH